MNAPLVSNSPWSASMHHDDQRHSTLKQYAALKGFLTPTWAWTEYTSPASCSADARRGRGDYSGPVVKWRGKLLWREMSGMEEEDDTCVLSRVAPGLQVPSALWSMHSVSKGNVTCVLSPQ